MFHVPSSIVLCSAFVFWFHFVLYIFQVRYFMDPAYMKPGETQMFLQHLSQQTMYIDVWDGDSLLPLGSTAVDLKV